MSIKYTHTNLIAKDWRRLAEFYQTVFGCIAILPERDLSGRWLDGATGLTNAHITGIHLLLPGYGEEGPTLELFQYDSVPEHSAAQPNTPGFSHIAFAVDDIQATASAILSNGGSQVGQLIEREIPGAGRLTFQYLTDPEGNIIEIQKWEKVRH